MRATASLVLSYRIDAGTPPKNAKAATCPAQNASSSPPDRPARNRHRCAAGPSQKVDLPFHPADHRKRFAEVRLRVPGIMPQWDKHLALPLPLRQHVVLHDRQAAGIAVLVAQALEDPLRCVPLLRRPAHILFKDPVDHHH